MACTLLLLSSSTSEGEPQNFTPGSPRKLSEKAHWWPVSWLQFTSMVWPLAGPSIPLEQGHYPPAGAMLPSSPTLGGSSQIVVSWLPCGGAGLKVLGGLSWESLCCLLGLGPAA